MKTRETRLIASLALAAAAFISAPGTAPAQQAQSRRRVGFRMFSGPLSVRAGRRVRFNTWRPPVGEKCGLRVTTTFVDARTGDVVGKRTDFTNDGQGTTATFTSPGTSAVRRVGVRARITPAADEKLGLRACELTGARRVIGGKEGIPVRGGLELLDAEEGVVTVLGASDLSPLYAADSANEQ